MPKLTQSGRQWETPQITPDQLGTEVHGGMSPDHVDVMKSANARSTSRHEVKKTHLADTDVLPDSAEMLGNELVGIKDHGYLSKKNLPFGVNAFYNSLPPGMDIEDQEICDIRKMEMVVYDTGLGFPGDGWSTRQRGSQMKRKKDIGRPSETNYMGTPELDPASGE